MKRSRGFLIIAFLLFTLAFSGVAFQTKAQAATLTNVMNAPKAKEGQWVIASRGYRYRYTSTQKYAKNTWLKISGNIYYFKSNGYLQTGWKTYNKKKYYFGSDGALVTGWKVINGKKYYLGKKTGSMQTGKIKIGANYYYFDTNGAMQTGTVKIGSYYYYFNKSTGAMTVNKTIGKYYYDKYGRRVAAAISNATADKSFSTTAKKTGKVDVFVGDSRTVGMGEAVGVSSKCIAKVGEGYNWFVNTALSTLKKKLKSNPTATVVINLGVNDLGNCSSYISKYQSLVKSYPKATFYFVSVNPVDSKYTWGYYTYSVMNTKIKSFNSSLKKAFPSNYIDCYSYLTKNGYSTVDGVHYTTATYQKIYKYILSQV